MPRIGQEKRSLRREQILEAAWRCAARQGFRDMTVDDVCAESGLSKGAFYGYFAQKRDLLVALFEDDSRRLDGLMDELEHRVPLHRDRLRQYMRAVLSRSSDPARVQVRADMWNAMLTEKEIRAAFAAGMRQRRVRLRSWIETAITARELTDLPANALAAILLALSDGLLLHGSLDAEAFRWVNIGKALDILMDGISL